jgi:hypothetical protein
VRTTLTLDDDVAARLERQVKIRGDSFKAVINDALRAGLDALEKPRERPKRFVTEGFDAGESLVGSLDDIEGVLSRVEGENHS